MFFAIGDMRTINSPDTFRQNVCDKMLYELWNNSFHATNLEKGVYNWAIGEATERKILKKWDNPYFVQLYTDHLRSIYVNLKKNAKLRDKVFSGEIMPYSIAFMTHYEIDLERWDKLIKEKIETDKNKYDVKLEATTDTYTCRNCKSNKCHTMQLQTRSADEPMTIFVTCLGCGKRWKG
jgi:transcription elongation factor S-II